MLTCKVSYFDHRRDGSRLVVHNKQEKRSISFGPLLNLNQLRVPLLNLLWRKGDKGHMYSGNLVYLPRSYLNRLTILTGGGEWGGGVWVDLLG